MRILIYLFFVILFLSCKPDRTTIIKRQINRLITNQPDVEVDHATDMVIPITRAKLIGNWFTKDNNIMTITSGAEVRLIVKGTSSLKLDYGIPINASRTLPIVSVKYRISGSAFSTWKRISTRDKVHDILTLLSSLNPNNSYEVHICFNITDSGNLWDGGGIIVNSLLVNKGSDYALPVRQPAFLGIGDSITGGILAGGKDAPSPVSETNYFHLGCDMLSLEPWHNGFGGTGINTGSASGIPVTEKNVFNYMHKVPKLQFTSFAVISINIGTNDKGAGVATGKFKAGYQSLIKKCRKTWPTAKIILMRPFNGSFANIIQTLAKEEDLMYMDTSSWEIETVDGLHPSIKGNALAAKEWSNWVRANLPILSKEQLKKEIVHFNKEY